MIYSDQLIFHFVAPSPDKMAECGSDTTSTAASTITDAFKDVTAPPAVVTLHDDDDKKDATVSKDPFLAFLATVEEIKEEMEAEDGEVEDKKPAAKETPTKVLAVKESSSVMPSAGDISAVATMPSAVGLAKQGGSTSVASSVTAATAFTSPSKKGKKILPKTFGSPGTGGKITMKTLVEDSATLAVHFWQTGFLVSCVCFLTGRNKKENYAWKQFLVERLIKSASSGEYDDWKDFKFPPTLTNVGLENRRAVPHGADVALTGWNDYPERYLYFPITSNPDFENARAKVEALGNKLLKLFRFDAFPSYYIGEMEKAFHGRKMSNSLQDANHELWKTIQQAKLVLVEEESLDSFFMDEKIIHLIPPPLWHKQTKEWPQAIVRKLYKSGELPAYFEDLTVSK